MKKKAALLFFFSLIVLLWGCSAAPSRFYTLSATARASPGGTSPYAVSVGPVTIPPAVDRPQIVSRIGPNQVRIDEFNRWASPLKADIARIVAENLSGQLGSARFPTFPQAAADEAAYRVTIDVLSLESVPGKSAAIDALWTVRRIEDGRVRSGRTSWKEPAVDPGYDALVAAHSRALERLSEDIAQALIAP